MANLYENLPPFSQDELDAIPRKVDSYYPSEVGRLTPTELGLSVNDWREGLENGGLVIPEGRWSIIDHPNRQNADRPISPIYTEEKPVPGELTEQWLVAGLRVDSVGRALFPRAEQVLEGPGMFTQPGAFYGYGPQRIANCALRRTLKDGAAEYATVWVKRDGKLCGSVPGGYADEGETILEAALREFNQETGSQLEAFLGVQAIRETVLPPHPYWKTTLHAWMEERFVFLDVAGNGGGLELRTKDPQEVSSTRWMSVDEIQRHPDFVGTHRRQVEAHEEFLRRS